MELEADRLVICGGSVVVELRDVLLFVLLLASTFVVFVVASVFEVEFATNKDWELV